VRQCIDRIVDAAAAGSYPQMLWISLCVSCAKLAQVTCMQPLSGFRPFSERLYEKYSSSMTYA